MEISREIAESLLCNFAKEHRCQNCYLLRSTPLQKGTYLPETYYVFAASYLRDNTLSHTRLYINKQNQLCMPGANPTANTMEPFIPVPVPHFWSFLDFLGLVEHCKPVPSDKFKLTISDNYNIVQPTVIVCNVDEKHNTNGYFNVVRLQ